MHLWSEQTDTHTRNNVARSRLALTAQTRQLFLVVLVAHVAKETTNNVAKKKGLSTLEKRGL